MGKRKYFGTDGVRGEANIELTPVFAMRLGAALGHILNQENEEPKVVIAMDTRISGEMLAAALASGLSSMGVNVDIIGVLPTPGLAFLTKRLEFDAGIMVSASHNPAKDNGIKIFTGDGFKLQDEKELEIESLIDNIDSVFDYKKAGDRVGKIQSTQEYKFLYYDFLKSSVHTKFRGKKVIVDEANGAASGLASKVFSHLGAQVVAINDVPNGTNINLKCGSTNIDVLSKVVRDYEADIGFAYDGDADRLITVDRNGIVVDGDLVITLMAQFLKEQGKLNSNKVVGTIMTNMGIEKYLESQGIILERTNVGDRYVLEKMLSDNLNLGGEQSGHIIMRDLINTGDGILSSLQLFQFLVETGKELSELTAHIQRYPQQLKNLRVDREKKATWQKNFKVTAFIEEQKKSLEGKGRVVIRESGTEPLIRIMVEAETQELVDTTIATCYEFLDKELN